MATVGAKIGKLAILALVLTILVAITNFAAYFSGPIALVIFIITAVKMFQRK